MGLNNGSISPTSIDQPNGVAGLDNNAFLNDLITARLSGATPSSTPRPGSYVLDLDTGALWQYTHGMVSWTQVATVPLGVGYNLADALTFIAGGGGGLWWAMPFQGPGYKKVVIQMVGYTDTVTINFPQPFTAVPVEVDPGNFISGITTTWVAITAVAGSGWVILEGF